MRTNYFIASGGYRVKKCKTCSSKLQYSDKYDAFYCAKENKWAEKKCGSKECGYCKDRPTKPLTIQSSIKYCKTCGKTITSNKSDPLGRRPHCNLKCFKKRMKK